MSRTSRAWTGIEPLVGALAPRDGGQPVQIRTDHRGLAALLAGALEAAQLALGLLAHGLRHAGLLDLGPVLVDDRALVLAELALDRVHLLAQEVLALLLLGAGLDVLADAAADLELGEPVALELEGERQALGDVEGLQQPGLLLEGQVGGVAGGVGQGAGLHDGAQERRDAPVVAAQVEDLLDHGAVLALELARAAVDRLFVGALLDVDAQVADGVGLRGARDAAVQAAERGRAPAAGEADGVGDLGHRADLGELVLVTGDEQHALLAAHVDGQGDVHGREDHGVIERDQKKGSHVLGLVCGGALIGSKQYTQ